MFGKLLLLFILALQLLILVVLYVNNPKSFAEAVDKLDPTGGDDAGAETGGEEGAPEGGENAEGGENEGSGLVEKHTNFSKKLKDF
ncbi:hypothetical protein EHP00_1658 [Ecytonucleospora hepatopenaei]|uniref:Uncharacterized protein n=1 Tax=Ecytonucleospora hepatopenaei TaxID=646526 RepID=A0A1W0E7Z5_9MICR|nr:hypothetical protein EHP00_1658 [Ecytonucleospora hepatopenaei]